MSRRRVMDVYAEDLKSELGAVAQQRRVNKSEAAPTFEANLSWAKRYFEAVRGRRSLFAGKAPNKGLGLNANVGRLLGGRLEQPFAKLSESLATFQGKARASLSHSSLTRTVRPMGLDRKGVGCV